MKIILAKDYGFCFGVKRAVKLSTDILKEKNEAYSFGELVHNQQMVEKLETEGLKVFKNENDISNSTVIIRSHGVSKETKNRFSELKNEVLDCTCPVLKNIYKKIEEKYNSGYEIIIVGDKTHPEVIGLAGQIADKAIIVGNEEEAELIKNKKNLYIISQTTNTIEKFLKISDIIKRTNEKVIVENTICNATALRQKSCEELAKLVDAMIVIGGKKSSNTEKLFQIAKKHCNNVFKIETFKDLSLQDVSKFNTIGVTAGASTPDWIIEEVVNKMDNYSKDQFMEQVEDSITKIYPKDVVKGTIIYVTDTEVMVNIGYRADGIIKLDELSTDENAKPKDLFKEGQEIDVYIIKLDDGEGNVVLSTRRVEGLKNWEALVEKYNNNETVEAKVKKEVKGGLLATVSGINVFIPGSHITTHFVKDLTPYVGKTMECKIISVDESKRRMVLSRKVIEEAEKQEKLDKAWEKIAINEILTGKVARLTEFGAFIDLGGVDGLIHVSDLSWHRINHPNEMLKVGDDIEVIVLRANKEKNRISLGLKQLTKKPFEEFLEKYHVGDIVEGEIVNLLDFGAFVKIIEGVEGLIHVSQISYEHVEKPSDELNIGDKIKVKILEINEENKRVALSIKATLPVPEKIEKPAPKNEVKKEEIKEQKFENQELDNSIGSMIDLDLEAKIKE